MRTVETYYNLPPSLPGDPLVYLAVTWEIEFEEENDSLLIKSKPVAVQVTIGGEPFGETKVRTKPADGLRDWLRVRASDLTFEKIGYTESEAWREYFEEKEEADAQGTEMDGIH